MLKFVQTVAGIAAASKTTSNKSIKKYKMINAMFDKPLWNVLLFGGWM